MTDDQSADPGPRREPPDAETMASIGRVLDTVLNGYNCPTEDKKFVFFLTVYPANMHGDYKYICNIARHQVEVTLRHIIDQLQSGPMKPGWDDG